MSTITNIERALQILIRADVPPRIEDHVRGQIAVLMGLDVMPTSLALQVGQRLARLARLAGGKSLLLAARELGAEIEPAPPAEHKAEQPVAAPVKATTVLIEFLEGDLLHRFVVESTSLQINLTKEDAGQDRIKLDLLGRLQLTSTPQAKADQDKGAE